MQSGIVVENWALSVDQCQLQVLQFSVHLIDLLSILLRCNGFTRFQKTVVDQMGSRPPTSDHDVSLVQVLLWEVLWSFFSVQPLSWTLLVVIQNLSLYAYITLVYSFTYRWTSGFLVF